MSNNASDTVMMLEAQIAAVHTSLEMFIRQIDPTEISLHARAVWPEIRTTLRRLDALRAELHTALHPSQKT